jgi:elongation factor Ts
MTTAIKMREGMIDAYIHHNKIGVLVEVNCKTDFAARCEEFKTLVRNIAMQIAACSNVEYVKVEDIPAEIVAKITEIERNRDDLVGKPDRIKEKIIQGRIEKRLKEISLINQPYIRDQSMTVAELVQQAIATLGEEIVIRRFTRYELEPE